MHYAVIIFYSQLKLTPMVLISFWLQEGDFEMKHIDKVGSKTFNAVIAPFSLSTYGDGTDTL